MAREKVFDISMMMIRNAKIIPSRENLRYRVIMTMIKIERKEEEGRAIKIALPNIESTIAEEKIEILEIEERKTNRTMIMRGVSMPASEEIEEKEKNEGIRTVIIAKTDRKEEASETKTATEEEIRAKKEEVEGTNITIGSVGIVITKEKDTLRVKTT